MAEVSAQAVKELREKTGAGMLDCKKALVECQGDFEKAVDYLRQKGLAAAAKKGLRAALEGTIASYIHANGKIGVLVEVNCETDFVAKTEEFKTLIHGITMHIAAFSPLVVKREEVSADLLERERQIYKAQAIESGKTPEIAEKMVEGRLNSFYKESCLHEQAYLLNTDITVEQAVKEVIAKLGENIVIRRFVRFELGEGLERKKEDFATEVAKLVKQ